jgi:hypothetical protein
MTCPQCAAVLPVPTPEAREQIPPSVPRPLPTGRKASPPAKETNTGAAAPHAQERARKSHKRSKKKKIKPVLFWGLLGGGFAAVVLCVVILILVLSGTQGSSPVESADKSGADQQQPVTNQLPVTNKPPVTNKLLEGEWELAAGGKNYALEFTGEGKVHLGGDFAPLTDFRFAKPLKVLVDFGLRPGTNLDITYRCLSDTRLEIRANYLPLLEKLSAGATKAPSAEVVNEYTPTETLTYTVTEKELTLTNDQGKSLRLRRGG